jgi:hypothetical protein
MAQSFWAWLSRQFSQDGSRQASSGKLAKKGRLLVELLESRELLSGFTPDYVILPHAGATPFGSAGPTGMTPSQIRQAYGFNQITFNGVAGNGAGATIAIVDAYDDPKIANDLHQFDLAFGLPDPTFTKVNQSGGATMPAANAGWSSEIALDVEWAHAIAPAAKILLVEANDSSYANLMTAVTYAAKQPGVDVVSMSWGGGEFSGENSYDDDFTTPAGHTGVTFIISSGDSGAPASYPATSPNVLSVGGTTLNINSAGNIVSESAWSGSGGGISTIEAKPSYQLNVTQSSTKRTSPDVAYDADPNTGFPVYDTENNSTSAPWSQFGGTSDAAPQWAALIAIADQGRVAAGLTPLDGPSQTLPDIYNLPASDFHDITTGTTTGTPHESAGPGYDLATGRGTPIANLIVAGLVGSTSSAPSATHFSVTTTQSTHVAGTAFNITVTALDASNHVVTGYLGTVQFTSTDAAALLPASYTFTSANAGMHTFSVTLKTAGSDGVTATGAGGVTGSLTETITPAAASKLVFSQQPGNAIAGAVIAPAVTVRVLDAYGNLVSSDNSDSVTLSIGANAGSGTLSGTKVVTVSGGVATFSSLSINNVGNGYTLHAASGSFTSATSSAFNVTATSTGSGSSSGSGTVVESFESSDLWNLSSGWYPTAYLSTAAAHDGSYGLDQYNGNEWIYRTDAGAQLHAGDTVSVWLEFAGNADGRAYFGFGASSAGTLSLVAAPNTGQLILQSNLGFGFTNLAAVNQSFLANHWYRLEVDWSTTGAILGKLFDSNGTTQLNQVAASTTAINSGGIAFRATGSDKYWDTVTATYGVNSFAKNSAAFVNAQAYSTSIDSRLWAAWFAAWNIDLNSQAKTNPFGF